MLRVWETNPRPKACSICNPHALKDKQINNYLFKKMALKKSYLFSRTGRGVR